jgi:hypothetical protein
MGLRILAEHDWLPNRSFIPPHPGPASRDNSLENAPVRVGNRDFAQRLTREAQLRQRVIDELERVDPGKTNLQLIYVENQDRAQCGQNEAGAMIS